MSALVALGTACSFTSLDGYFACPPGNKDCKNPALGVAGSDGAAGGAGSASSGVADGGGLAGEASSPAEPCVMTQDCTAGTCFRGMCGPAFVLSYQDTPETGSDPTQAKWIRFQFQIENRTSASYPLSAFTLRYYYTPERAVSQFQALSTSAPPADVSKVTGTFGKTNGWTYLEVGFTNSAGTLNGSGASTGIVKVGIHDQNFTDFVFYQPDDYSYLKPEHITLYLNSVLVAGVEPVTPPPQ